MAHYDRNFFACHSRDSSNVCNVCKCSSMSINCLINGFYFNRVVVEAVANQLEVRSGFNKLITYSELEI